MSPLLRIHLSLVLSDFRARRRVFRALPTPTTARDSLLLLTQHHTERPDRAMAWPTRTSTPPLRRGGLRSPMGLRAGTVRARMRAGCPSTLARAQGRALAAAAQVGPVTDATGHPVTLALISSGTTGHGSTLEVTRVSTHVSRRRGSRRRGSRPHGSRPHGLIRGSRPRAIGIMRVGAILTTRPRGFPQGTKCERTQKCLLPPARIRTTGRTRAGTGGSWTAGTTRKGGGHRCGSPSSSRRPSRPCHPRAGAMHRTLALTRRMRVRLG